MPNLRPPRHAPLVPGPALFVLLLSTATTVASEPSRPRKCQEIPQMNVDYNVIQQRVAAPAVSFGLDLYRAGARQGGNLVLSPFSIQAALGMTLAGARGDSEKQLAQALHLSGPLAEWHRSFGQAAASLLCAREYDSHQILLANRLFIQQGKAIRPSYQTILRDSYDASLGELDFVKQTEAARLAINGWVESMTQKKIRDLLRPGIVTADTRLVLANAIYLKDRWDLEFDKAQTRPGPFHRGATDLIQVPMMHSEGGALSYGYAEMKGFRALSMHMKDRQHSFVVLLPDRVEGLREVEASLTPQMLQNLMKGLGGRKVIVTLPRFKITSAATLRESLEKLGVRALFNAKQADLSEIDGGKDQLYLTEVVHKAFIDVNEEGIEAAAATAALMAAGAAMPRPTPPVEFKVDRPFLYLVVNTGLGLPLFMGRVSDPSKEG